MAAEALGEKLMVSLVASASEVATEELFGLESCSWLPGPLQPWPLTLRVLALGPLPIGRGDLSWERAGVAGVGTLVGSDLSWGGLSWEPASVWPSWSAWLSACRLLRPRSCSCG